MNRPQIGDTVRLLDESDNVVHGQITDTSTQGWTLFITRRDGKSVEISYVNVEWDSEYSVWNTIPHDRSDSSGLT